VTDTDLIELDDAAPANAVVSAETMPMEMLRTAVNAGNIELAEKLMALAERHEANQARRAFNEAFAAFKAEAVIVVRNRRVTDGPLKGRSYAELVSFVEAATPALSKHGLSASWDVTRDDKEWIEVTCTIEHVLGGNKRVSLGGPPDTGGAKNALQARISTVTYLERATFKAALGLAEQGDDNDGVGGARDGFAVTAEQVKQIENKLAAVGADKAKFLDWLAVETLAELPAYKFAPAMGMLDRKAAARKEPAT
jgi:hypothetical protein